MIYKKMLGQSFLFIFSFLLLQSCSDNSLSPLEPVISGQVLNSIGNPVPDLIIKSGGQTTTTNENGTYSFRNIAMPYDILIIDQNSKSQQLIKSISLRIAIIPEFLTLYNPDYKSTVSVKIPAELITAGKKGKLIYTDGYAVNSTADILSENTSLEIRLKQKYITEGKIIILIYSEDNNGKIISYDNYGEMDNIQVTPGGHQSLEFTSSDLSFNPEEKNITGRINIPAGYSSSQQYFFLNFALNNSMFDIHSRKYSDIDGNNFSIVVPDQLHSEFSIMVNNYIQDASFDKYCLETFTIPKNINNIELQQKLPAALISPVNNSTEVDLNSEISYSPGSGSGVYVTRFVNDGKIFSVVTSDNSYSLNELKNFDIPNIKNEYFTWSVQKYGDVNNVDDFLDNFPQYSGSYLSKSEQWMFKTAP